MRPSISIVWRNERTTTQKLLSNYQKSWETEKQLPLPIILFVTGSSQNLLQLELSGTKRL